MASARDQEMAALFQGGMNTRELGERFGISHQRVCQILNGRFSLHRLDGGDHQSRESKREQERTLAEASFFAKYGCTRREMDDAHAYADSCQSHVSPLRAFYVQKGNAKLRGIGWALSFWDWWQVWQRSGLWPFRGRGQAYVMCRCGDQGSYAVGNVFIGTSISNSSEKKRSNLPLGVKQRDNRFFSTRMLHGRTHYLGCFLTAQAAHSAYLSLAPISPQQACRSPQGPGRAVAMLFREVA